MISLSEELTIDLIWEGEIGVLTPQAKHYICKNIDKGKTKGDIFVDKGTTLCKAKWFVVKEKDNPKKELINWIRKFNREQCIPDEITEFLRKDIKFENQEIYILKLMKEELIKWKKEKDKEHTTTENREIPMPHWGMAPITFQHPN